MSYDENERPSPSANELVALLATGQLPDVGAAIMTEATKRWNSEPVMEYNESVQAYKMGRAEAKRLMRANKRLKKDMDNRSGDLWSSSTARALPGPLQKEFG